MATVPRCAVIFKTYAWDAFVERQARRLAEAAGALDFYISVDETGGPVGPIPFERVVRFTCAELAAAGLPMRFAVGGVLWWNPDYAHYQFLAQHRDYECYLFVEYDCVVQCSLEQFAADAISRGADLIALPITRPFRAMALDVVPAQCLSCSRGKACIAQRLFSVCSRVNHVALAAAGHEG